MDTKTPEKPDWGLRIGIGLWIAIGCAVGWAVFRILGWHIPSWFLYAVVIGLGCQFIITLISNSLSELAREIEKINARLDDMDRLIANIGRHLRDRD